MLTGQNGILTQAQNAKNSTIQCTEQEAISIAYTGSLISDITGNSTSMAKSIGDELKENGYNATVIPSGDSIKVTMTDTGMYIL